MVARRKLTILSILILICSVFLFQLTSCKNSDTKADIGYGKTYFMDNCSACHGRYKGFDNAPSILTMYNYDSLILLKKLVNIKQDSIHKNYFNSEKYSDKEINSLLLYIREYFEPRF